MKPERPYTERDQLLKRWLKGDVRRREQRELEALAQDDPFLADAMEGYQGLPEGEHLEAVTQLKSKLRNRTEGRQGAGFYLARMAAVGALLLAAWVVFNQFGNENKAEMTISQMDESSPEKSFKTIEEKGADGTSEIQAEVTEEVDFEDEGEEAVAIEEPANAPKTTKRKAKKEEVVRKENGVKELAISDGKNSNKKKEAAKESAGISEPADGEIASVQTEAAPPTAAKTQPMPSAEDLFDDASIPPYEEPENIESTAPVVYKVVGKVTNEFDQPLTGARVVVEGAQRGTVTDSDGLFSIETEAIQPNLEVSYLGYEDQSLAIDEEAFVNVQMKESETLLEEVTVASSERNKSSLGPPQPNGGFSKLEKYIRKNRLRPIEGQKEKGEVRLSFNIGEDGVPTNFEILHSLGEAYDEEAKRLLREGPRWKGDTTEIVTYSIGF